VPRHTERFSTVAQFLDRSGFRYIRRTAERACEESTAVLLGDTMGEVPLFYAASDIAFVGGTLVPVGGHNLLEPAALGKPVLAGPYLFNTQEIADLFMEVGAATLVHDERELAREVLRLLANPAQAVEQGGQGYALLTANRGALGRLLDLLEPTMRAFADDNRAS
jgi:3-deoxy-D-manno-octulosonic-acid transferase